MTASTTTEGLMALGQSALNAGDHPQAYQWFHSAARSSDPRALNMLGRCYHQGWGVPVDPRQAARLFLAAAQGGDAWGMFNLADLYYRGDGLSQDTQAAYHWYSQAARKGHAKALNMLGLLHEDGEGVPHSLLDAAAYFRAAAEGGDCWGCFNFARLCLQAGDKAQAIRWLKESLSYGFPDFFRALATALQDETDLCLRALAHRARALAEHRSQFPKRGSCE